ncbi:MAG: hypothetical protein MI924_20940 [Chloroflexales bacterium]|nr:hypothetical protein [Chloroflexales bacterium]
MMQELPVILREATDDGRLIYQHDPEVADYLISLQSPRFTHVVYHVELEDPVLFSLNANRILGALEIVIPRHAWRIAPAQATPTANLSASLAFSPATIQQHSFDLFADVTTDAAFTYALIIFGQAEISSFWVALSDHCWALLADDRLKGFLSCCTNCRHQHVTHRLEVV